MKLCSRKMETIWNKTKQKTSWLQVTISGKKELVLCFWFFTFQFEIILDLLKAKKKKKSDSCDPMGYSPQAPLSMEFFRHEYWNGNCHALLQRIFPTWGWNLRLLHCKWILYHLTHQGSPESINRKAFSSFLKKLFSNLIALTDQRMLTVQY